MKNPEDWLPPLVLFDDFEGDWKAYLEAIYDFFKQDFVDSKPVFQGRRLGLKRHPLTDDKEATFWHMTQEGGIEDDRTPDLRRCERIRWPKPIIEGVGGDEVKVWWNQRKSEKRICLWCEKENYLVVLADRGDYILPWTAYLVNQPHRKRKLQKEYEAYLKDEAEKG
jgi:hypothetical protein